MKKQFTLSEKYKYFCSKSKKGAKNENGKELSDFERGTYFGMAKQIRIFASIYNRNKTIVNSSKSKNLNENRRDYSETSLNKLFDNYKEIKFD